MLEWSELNYWKSGEWQVVEERLADLDKAKIPYCPGRRNLFKSLDLVPLDKVRVVILGQDPYPDPEFATGLAFSIPATSTRIPPTLSTIFKEYTNDLHLDQPKNGDLSTWCEQGVLLWNVLPSCEAWHSLSHNWVEWDFLTLEILDVVSQTPVVVAALGSVPARYLGSVREGSRTIVTSHPSPRGQLNAKNPFIGSRLFSTINDHLCSFKQEPIDWKLP